VVELPSGTVTFLFTDIEGSTELLRRLGDGYGRVLGEHQALLREAFEAHSGREVDTQGDSFFVAFSRTHDAVAAALEAQRSLVTHEWPKDGQPKVRMGIHTGPGVFAGDRYVGLPVHRAARISAAAHGGQVLVSDTAHTMLDDESGTLPDGAGFRDLGEHRLKDFDRPVRIYQVTAEDLRRDFPPIREPSLLRRNRWPLAAVAALILAAVALGVILLTRSASNGPAVLPNSVGLIDASSNEVVGQIGVGTLPQSIAVGNGGVWVANVTDRSVSHLDVDSRSVVRTIPLGKTPDSVAVGTNGVWVLHGLLGSLTRIDPGVDDVTKRIEGVSRRSLAGGGGAVTIGGGAIWAAFSNATVAKVVGNRVVARDVAGRTPAGAAFGEGALWIANRTANNVYRFNPVTFGSGRQGPPISVGSGPRGVAVGGGYVWVADTDADAVSRIEPGSGSSTSFPVGSQPTGIAFGAGSVWVANSGSGTVTRLDPASGETEATVHVGNSPSGVAVGAGLVWVTVDAK